MTDPTPPADDGLVHIRSDGTTFGTSVTFHGHVIPAEAVTLTANTARSVLRAVVTVPHVVLDAYLSPDLVEFVVSRQAPE